MDTFFLAIVSFLVVSSSRETVVKENHWFGGGYRRIALVLYHR